MDLKRLNQVMAVARTGSFSRAAEELHLTQPALSRSIAALEARYGIRIFERGRGGAVLTEVGKLAVAQAETLLRDARSLEHNFRLYGTGEGGRIAFGMGPLIASMVLPGLGTHFTRNRPELRLVSFVQSAEALYQALMGDRIEVLFCAGDQLAGEKDIRSESVGTLERSIVVRAGHPLVDSGQVRQADLERYTLLSGVDLAGRETEPAGGYFICDNYHVLREMVLETDAVWMTSARFVADELKAQRLRVLSVIDDPLATELTVSMVSRSGNRLSPAAGAIRDYVGRYFSAA